MKRGKECLFAREQKNVGLKFASAEKDVCAQRRQLQFARNNFSLRANKKSKHEKENRQEGLNLSAKGFTATTQEKLVMVRNKMRSEIGVGVIAVKN